MRWHRRPASARKWVQSRTVRPCSRRAWRSGSRHRASPRGRARRSARRGRARRARAAGRAPAPPACVDRSRDPAPCRAAARHVEALQHAQRLPLGVDGARHAPDARRDHDVLEEREAASRPAASVSTPVRRRTASPSVAGSRPRTAASAGVGPEDAVEQPDGGRLPRPVGPEQGHDLSRRDLQRELVDGRPARERRVSARWSRSPPPPSPPVCTVAPGPPPSKGPALSGLAVERPQPVEQEEQVLRRLGRGRGRRRRRGRRPARARAAAPTRRRGAGRATARRSWCRRGPRARDALPRCMKSTVT